METKLRLNRAVYREDGLLKYNLIKRFNHLPWAKFTEVAPRLSRGTSGVFLGQLVKRCSSRQLLL